MFHKETPCEGQPWEDKQEKAKSNLEVSQKEAERVFFLTADQEDRKQTVSHERETGTKGKYQVSQERDCGGREISYGKSGKTRDSERLGQ